MKSKSTARTKGATLRRQGNQETGTFTVTFRDPREWQDPKDHSKGRKVVRRSLKTRDRAHAEVCLLALNRIIADPNLWENPPSDTPAVVRELWGGELFTVTVDGKKVPVVAAPGEVRQTDPLSSDLADWVNSDEPEAVRKYLEFRAIDPDWWENAELAAQMPAIFTKDSKLRSTANALRTAIAEIHVLRDRCSLSEHEVEALRNENKALRHRLQRYDRRAAKAAEVGTLEEELHKYLTDVQARKITRTRKGILKSTLTRFVQELGPARKADDITEQEVSRYIQGYRQDNGAPVGEERRREIRLQTCTFMETATNFVFTRKAVAKISGHKVARERKPIVWLEPAKIKALIDEVRINYGDYWGDLAAVQAYMGFRPSELILLQKANVRDNVVELVPIVDTESGVSHAKTGARAVRIPEEAVGVIERRVDEGEGPLLFGALRKMSPKAKKEFARKDGRKGLLAKAWNEGVFYKQYTAILREAAGKAGITEPVDGRTLRRSFGSVAIRSGHSVEEVARVMGDRPSTIRRHYARLEAKEVDISGLTLIDRKHDKHKKRGKSKNSRRK